MNKLYLNSMLYFKKSEFFRPLRWFLQKHIDLVELRTANWIDQAQDDEMLAVSDYEPAYQYKLGILKEFWHTHRHYINACRDLRVKYKVLDVTGPNWQEVIELSGCDAFLVVPSVSFSNWKQMYDERVRVIVKDMRRMIFPSYDELWMWESKRRMHYWLKANHICHPQTWVFYDRAQALQFADTTPLPIVFKSNLGSGASGIIIFETRPLLRKHINRCFRKGYTNYRRGPNDKEIGSILFQEYLPNIREWRVVRIGKSYFGFEKLKNGHYHSGSHLRSFSKPPLQLLEFARNVFEKGGFNSLSLDIFIAEDGRYFVNELQTYFGIIDNHEMCVVDGIPGRMVYDPTQKQWDFEAGSFCENYLYNQRVLCVLNMLDQQATDKSLPCKADYDNQ